MSSSKNINERSELEKRTKILNKTPPQGQCSKKHVSLTTDELKEYFKLLDVENKLDKELAELEEQENKHSDINKIIDLLHEYNDIKDATQVVLGTLARMNNVTIASLHEEYDLPLNDE